MAFYPSAKIVCDSLSPLGDRLITFQVEFHRFILAEFNTHRTFSRNFQSSRAVPVERLLELVLKTPAIPVHWGKNRPGMSASEENDRPVQWPWGAYDAEGHLVKANYSREDAWAFAGECAATIAKAFHEAGYHKQIVNRLIEPFLPVRGVVTATEHAFAESFKSRTHAAAQPEFQALAREMRGAIATSSPKRLAYGEWHIPYARENDSLSLEERIKVAISCCAQVSYRKLDDSLEKALDIYTKLNLPTDGVYPENPPHFSPAEHVAKCCFTASEFSGNFACRSFLQYRKALEQGFEKDIIKESE